MRVDLTDVHRAIENDEVVPCFQPIVELRTGRLAGFEVLARWQHPDLGLILPENFISLAEESGLIGLLTQQILRKSFLAGPMLPEPLTLAVNFSPVQLRDLSLPGQVRRSAVETGYPLERLVVEITETALVNDLERARKIAVELKAMGCRLALDDFGTGYSSLRHLQALPFSELKVDRSFVESMVNKRESRKIVAAVVGLSYGLGMATVAEGIEEEQQADILLWLGCEYGQGWLYGAPLPAGRIPGMVTALPRTLPVSFAQGKDMAMSSLEALPALRLAQLQAIYNGVPVGLCFLDRNQRYVSINQRLADMNGHPVAAHIGRTVQEMIPRMYPLLQPYIQRALQGEPVINVEVPKPNPRPGEADLTVLLSYQPAFDEAQEVIGISVALMDITERKRAEDARRETEEHYRRLIESNPQMPWVRDAEGNLVDVSARWSMLTGMSKEQARNLGWLDTVHPEDLGHLMKAMREAMHAGKPIDVQYRLKIADGTWKWMRSRGTPHFGSSGELLGWYGGTEDIEEYKQMEEALRRSRA